MILNFEVWQFTLLIFCCIVVIIVSEKSAWDVKCEVISVILCKYLDDGLDVSDLCMEFDYLFSLDLIDLEILRHNLGV